ncbi:hypothetical protein ACLOAV_001158 [Pseudogymnoascus australis]
MADQNHGFTRLELKIIEFAERVTSGFSILGCAFVIVTFVSMKIFRKPINRLVFYATFGNLATNLATMISRNGITGGYDAPICQIQAFLIQMCMPADTLWMFSMALNVYLTFFHRFSGEQLIALEPYYLAFNYGVPFIPAIAFVFIRTEEHGHIFGDATLWCWVRTEWSFLRVATFYGPVWVILISTMVIYIIVGKIVFENQARFRELSKIASRNQANLAAAAVAAGADPSILEQGFGSRATDVTATSRSCGSHASPAQCKAASCTVKVEASSRGSRGSRFRRSKEKKEVSSADRAAWSYLKCALLFFTAMVITWVPATTNRVVSLFNPKINSFGLYFVEALLLPLQGFFNCMIYISISTDACNYLRPHCKRMFIMIILTPIKYVIVLPFVFVFIKPLRYLTGLSLPIPLEHLTIPPKPHRTGAPASHSVRPTLPLPSSSEHAARRYKGYIEPIRPDEIEDYERLHKKLGISPEPGSSTGSSSYIK